MSTFEEDEVGQDTSKPQELYRFYGTLGAYTYTAGNRAVNFAAPSANLNEAYKPVPISRSEIVLGDVTEKNDVKIDLPRNLSLIDDYVFDISPTDDLILEIYRQQDRSGVYQLIFYGVVAGFTVADKKVTATCPSSFSNYLGTEFPNIYYQSNCNHVLYDSRCGVSRDLFKVTATVVVFDDDKEGFTFAITGDLPPGNGTAVPTAGSKTFNGVTYNPSDYAEWTRYLSDYPDVAKAAVREVQIKDFTSPQDFAAWHYQSTGRFEGRVVHPTPGATASRQKVYNGIYYSSADTAEWERYLADYPDVAAQAARETADRDFATTLDFAAWHYQSSGRFEGRTVYPTPGFDDGDDGGGSLTDGYLVPGELVIGNERRLIVSHVGNYVELNYPLRRIAVGDEIVMYAGCRHNSDDCINKFNNGDNFLGFEYIPYINPFEVGIK